MKIIVLTNGSEHGFEIIKQLKASNIGIHSIVKEKKLLRKRELEVLRSKLGIASFLVDFLPFKNILYQVFRKIAYNDLSTKDLKPYTNIVHEVSNFNASDCTEFLKQQEPDLIILGGSRIIKNRIIVIPKIGVLNAHPGLLPEYRGVDVIQWALYNDDDVGVTVHFVDEGIDTGAICMRETLELSPGLSLQEIKAMGRKLAAKLMAKTVNNIVKEGKIDRIANETRKGNYYTTMPKEKGLELYAKLNKND